MNKRRRWKSKQRRALHHLLRRYGYRGPVVCLRYRVEWET
jgi:hypothetical protein